MSLGLGPVCNNDWLDDFLVNEGYERKKRLYHEVVRCWCGCDRLNPIVGSVESVHQYQQCEGCNSLLLKNVLQVDELKELYGIRYFREHQVAIGAPPFHVRYEQDALDRIPFWIHYLKRFSEKGTVLEVGSSHGRFVKELTENGYKATGLELDEEICAWAKNITGCDIRCSSIDELRNEKFDIIFANDVLEHLYDPLGFMNLISIILKTNGMAIFQTVVFDDKEQFPIAMMRPLYHTVLFSRKSIDLLTGDRFKLISVDHGMFDCKLIVFEKVDNSKVSKIYSFVKSLVAK